MNVTFLLFFSFKYQQFQISRHFPLQSSQVCFHFGENKAKKIRLILLFLRFSHYIWFCRTFDDFNRAKPFNCWPLYEILMRLFRHFHYYHCNKSVQFKPKKRVKSLLLSKWQIFGRKSKSINDIKTSLMCFKMDAANLVRSCFFSAISFLLNLIRFFLLFFQAAVKWWATGEK